MVKEFISARGNYKQGEKKKLILLDYGIEKVELDGEVYEPK